MECCSVMLNVALKQHDRVVLKATFHIVLQKCCFIISNVALKQHLVSTKNRNVVLQNSNVALKQHEKCCLLRNIAKTTSFFIKQHLFFIKQHFRKTSNVVLDVVFMLF